MLRLILAFVDVMSHRRGPEDMPSSSFLLWLLFALSLGLEFAVTLWAGGTARYLAVAVLVAGFDLWFVWALLRTFGRERRFRQTMIALLGADVLLGIIHAPLVPFLVGPAPEPPTVTLPVVLHYAAVVWSLDISAFVFSRAVERPYFLCIAIVVGYVLLIRSLQLTLLQPVS